jgi:geranylgeranyl pyrophosphate synthase
MNLANFTNGVHERARLVIERELHDDSLRALLCEIVERFAQEAASSRAAQPLSLLYLVLKAWKPKADEQALDAGAACTLYLCSLDLLDDVQDADLVGKPYEHAGTPVAMNCGLALLFLSLDSLRRTAQGDRDGQRALCYLSAFNRASVAAVAGQHVDLVGAPAGAAPETILDSHRNKASSVGLLLEFGAILGGCADEHVERYRRAGSALAGLVQIIDDLRDIFGKEESPDLRDQKMTYPMACFLRDASAAQRDRFGQCQQALPGSLPELRELFYEVGVVESCADAVDELRQAIHREIAATGNRSPAHRVLLSLVDALASGIYTPEPVPETIPLFEPDDAFSRQILSTRREFARDLLSYPLPALPALTPWHLPHFEYDPERRTIFYPDIDGLSGETLPFYVALFGSTDEHGARSNLVRHMPFVVAHEMFHFLRDSAGHLSSDHWHEEYVANRLALAYARRFCPEALRSALQVADRVLRSADSSSSALAERVATRSKAQSDRALGYEVDREGATVVHARMLCELAGEPLHLDGELWRWLDLRTTTVVAAE